MAEPTTSTTIAVATGLGFASALPFINADALIGALLGASLVVAAKRNISGIPRLISLLLSVGIGYLLSPEITARTPIAASTSSFIAAIFAIPIVLKIMVWVDNSTLSDLLRFVFSFLQNGLTQLAASIKDSKDKEGK